MRARVALLAFFLSNFAFADLTRTQFQKLAEELAPKVNLFADAWEIDPLAEVYGGTTRDYLYWLKAKLRSGTTPDELRAMEMIDVRELIIGESDVDMVSSQPLGMQAAKYGVKKIDSIDRQRFDPENEKGKNELDQGYIPAEKIRLGKTGFVSWAGVGDGIGEIYSGRLTVHFAPREQFERTHFAKEKLNHPVLLALRYLRLAAINYYRDHGEGFPDDKALFDLDPNSAAAVKAVIADAAKDGALLPYLENEKFREWLTGTMQKAFRSFTNPTATKRLFEEFGVAALSEAYPDLPTYLQFVFQKKYDPDVVRKNLRKFAVKKRAFYEKPLGDFLYHGTRTPANFRSILFQGILPSDHGLAGVGLYGVTEADISFAEKWGGSPDRVVKFPVSPTATLVDITVGEGKRVFEAFQGTEDEFSNAFGVDILRYKYEPKAFVVKNAAALGRPEGHKLQLLTYGQLKSRAEKITTQKELTQFGDLLELNGASEREAGLLFSTVAATSPNRRVQILAGHVGSLLKGEGFPLSKSSSLNEALRLSARWAGPRRELAIRSGFVKDLQRTARKNFSEYFHLLEELLLTKSPLDIKNFNPFLRPHVFPSYVLRTMALLQQDSMKNRETSYGLLKDERIVATLIELVHPDTYLTSLRSNSALAEILLSPAWWQSPAAAGYTRHKLQLLAEKDVYFAFILMSQLRRRKGPLPFDPFEMAIELLESHGDREEFADVVRALSNLPGWPTDEHAKKFRAAWAEVSSCAEDLGNL